MGKRNDKVTKGGERRENGELASMAHNHSNGDDEDNKPNACDDFNICIC